MEVYLLNESWFTSFSVLQHMTLGVHQSCWRDSIGCLAGKALGVFDFLKGVLRTFLVFHAAFISNLAASRVSASSSRARRSFLTTKLVACSLQTETTKLEPFCDEQSKSNTVNFDDAAVSHSFTLATHHFLKPHCHPYAPPLPPPKVHMLLVQLKRAHFNAPQLEHEQDRFRAPSFWASTNKDHFIASMFFIYLSLELR